MTEIEQPTTVRRTVAFSTAVWDGEAAVEGITGRLCGTPEEVRAAAERDEIAVLVDPGCRTLSWWKPDVLVDAVIAKVNTGTSITDAPIVIGVGPGFAAGTDCHLRRPSGATIWGAASLRGVQPQIPGCRGSSADTAWSAW